MMLDGWTPHNRRLAEMSVHVRADAAAAAELDTNPSGIT
jgi:hypothetical protein